MDLHLNHYCERTCASKASVFLRGYYRRARLVGERDGNRLVTLPKVTPLRSLQVDLGNARHWDKAADLLEENSNLDELCVVSTASAKTWEYAREHRLGRILANFRGSALVIRDVEFKFQTCRILELIGRSNITCLFFDDASLRVENTDLAFLPRPLLPNLQRVKYLGEQAYFALLDDTSLCFAEIFLVGAKMVQFELEYRCKVTASKTDGRDIHAHRYRTYLQIRQNKYPSRTKKVQQQFSPNFHTRRRNASSLSRR